MLKNVLSLFLESRCPLCDRSTPASVCEFCQRQLRQCQLKNPCRYWQGDLPIFAWGVYRGPLKRAIAALKYSDHRQLGNLLGNWLGQAWLNSPCGRTKKLTVVPIPLHPQKLQTRGFNQAELIARSFCELTGYSFKPHGLRRVRETEAMYTLTGHQREKNIENALRVNQQWRNRSPVLIVDDIYTTGTTVQEAARQLRLQNIQVQGAATVSVALSSNTTATE